MTGFHLLSAPGDNRPGDWRSADGRSLWQVPRLRFNGETTITSKPPAMNFANEARFSSTASDHLEVLLKCLIQEVRELSRN